MIDIPLFQEGGNPQQELMMQIAQALQQGMQPEQLLKSLVQEMRIPQEQAMRMIQSVMQQMQGEGQEQVEDEEVQYEQDEEGNIQMKKGGYLKDKNTYITKDGRETRRGLWANVHLKNKRYEDGGYYYQTGGYESVADYAKASGRGSSFSDRAKLAKELGISNYRGRGDQNIALLQKLQEIDATRGQLKQDKDITESENQVSQRLSKIRDAYFSMGNRSKPNSQTPIQEATVSQSAPGQPTQQYETMQDDEGNTILIPIASAGAVSIAGVAGYNAYNTLKNAKEMQYAMNTATRTPEGIAGVARARGYRTAQDIKALEQMGLNTKQILQTMKGVPFQKIQAPATLDFSKTLEGFDKDVADKIKKIRSNAMQRGYMLPEESDFINRSAKNTIEAQKLKKGLKYAPQAKQAVRQEGAIFKGLKSGYNAISPYIKKILRMKQDGGYLYNPYDEYEYQDEYEEMIPLFYKGGKRC